jgi:hypothetical protein
LGLDVEVTGLSGLSLKSDLLLLLLNVLLDILVGSLEDGLSLGLRVLVSSALGATKHMHTSRSGRSVVLVQPRKMVNLKQHRRS